MSIKKIGYGITFIGLIGLVASFAVDWLGLGDKRIGASQLLGIQIGIMLVVLGITLLLFHPEKQVHFNIDALERLYSLPSSFWITLGFVFVYVLLYLFPVFLNHERSMVYFNRYIPNKYPIGLDLQITMGTVEPWVTTGESPYPKLFYPPLTYIVFAPMALIDYPISYFVITFLTFLSYCLLAGFAIFQIGHTRDYSMLALIFVSGLFSYGFQFELERGQFNVITFLLCMLSIYIFWRHEQFRYLAYLLFSISIHVKLYPAIFILLFIKDWRDWKTNLKQIAGLGLFNFTLLFVLGYSNFIAFMDTLLIQLLTPSWSWNGNHSIQAFVFDFLKDGYNLLSNESLAFLQQNSSHITVILLILILACILTIVARAYIQRENGFNPYLLLACTLGALIIPTSNDLHIANSCRPNFHFLLHTARNQGF